MSKSDQIQEAAPTISTRQQMLLDFLRAYDADCPVCGYNVCALTRPICPECRQELVLTVGAARLRMGWLFAAVAPGFFSGIAALFVLIPIVGRYVFGDGKLELVLIALDLFGWCSLLFAIMLGAKLNRFIAQPRARQRWFALIIWIVHITAFVLFLIIARAFL
ncbi:MAG: hypothetical protein L0Y44_06315 [Phycisphaerales bacterium]|nr:hypothetical protein [Phycisphaerales bacterium]